MTRLDVWHDVVEETCNGVTWKSETEAEIECPGSRYHNSPGQTAALFLTEVPTISCFHSSCKSTVEQANQEFRSECRKRELAAGLQKEWTAEEKKEWRERKAAKREAEQRRKRIVQAAQAKLPDILDCYRRPIADWISASPHDAPRMPARYQMDEWLASLPPDWRLWVGSSVKETGHRRNCRNFATAQEWLDRKVQLGPFGCSWQQVCPADFAPWRLLHDRKTSAVRERRLFTMEFDHLDERPEVNKECTLAVASWLCHECGMQLFSACDSAKKSVHCHFIWPEGGPKEWLRLTTILEAMGADPALWRLASTTRLPGGLRFNEDDNLPIGWQRLYYLDPDALERSKGTSLTTHPDHVADAKQLGGPDENQNA